MEKQAHRWAIVVALVGVAAGAAGAPSRPARPAGPAKAARPSVHEPVIPPQNPALPPAHCAIVVKQLKRSGASEVVAFRSALRSQRECATLAKLHEPNFQPGDVLAKKVTYTWLGAQDAPKTASHHPARKHGAKSLSARAKKRRHQDF